MLNRAVPGSVDENKIHFEEGLDEPKMIVRIIKIKISLFI